MAIDTQAMDALLARIDTVRSALQSPVARQAGPASTTVDFSAALKATIDRVNEAQQGADALAQRFQLGDSKVSLEETMVAMSKASLSFQQMVQVRNRVVAAYQEIMNMQV
jgi:flagellar hook-basal body complex protein FliE